MSIRVEEAAMAMSKSNQVGLIIGLPFTLIVLGSLIYLHFFASPVVPKPRDQGDIVPDLLVCEGEVPWVTPEVAGKALEFWNAHGHPMGVFKRVPCALLELCKTTEEKPRTLPCSRGNVVVSLRDQQYDEEHLGEAVSVFEPKTGKVSWSTIMLPSALLPPEGAMDEDGNFVAQDFPPDVGALVLTHEIGHWFGYDHVQTPMPGPFFAEPTGHILTRSVFKQGWRSEGLPQTAKK